MLHPTDTGPLLSVACWPEGKAGMEGLGTGTELLCLPSSLPHPLHAQDPAITGYDL